MYVTTNTLINEREWVFNTFDYMIILFNELMVVSVDEKERACPHGFQFRWYSWESHISFSNFFIKHLLHKIIFPLSHICSQKIARFMHKKDEVLVKVKVFLAIVGNLDMISKMTKTLIFGRVWDLSWC